MGRQLHSQSVAPFVPRKHLPDRAFPGAVLPPRGRWMCCAGFPWAFGLPSTAAAQGNQPMISELRAVTLVPGLEPNARNAGEKRLAAGGCLQACTGKDRVSFHTGGAPALRPGAIAQSPGREAALCWASLPKPSPAASRAPSGGFGHLYLSAANLRSEIQTLRGRPRTAILPRRQCATKPTVSQSTFVTRPPSPSAPAYLLSLVS